MRDLSSESVAVLSSGAERAAGPLSKLYLSTTPGTDSLSTIECATGGGLLLVVGVEQPMPESRAL